MPQTKPDYMLVERGRYYYQRKVPLDLQAAVGRKKWRAALGKDFDEAYGLFVNLHLSRGMRLQNWICMDNGNYGPS